MAHRKLMRFALVFLVGFLVLDWAYTQTNDTVLQTVLIDSLTVKPGVWLLNQLHWAAPVTAQGNQLVSAQGGLSIRHGCDGIEAMLLVIAAFIAVPLTWRRKLSGILIVLFLVYVLNEVRIVVLFLAVLHNRSLFNVLHGIVSPILLIAAASGFFWYWALRHDDADA